MKGALKYERETSSEDSTSVTKLLRWIQSKTSVLEMGPATGVMTKHLQSDKQCNTTCIEIDPDAAARAEPFCNRMIIGDLNDSDWDKVITGERFDYIVFADVLEHLYDPYKVLWTCKKYLTEKGEVLISIPNIGYQGVIADLMQGRFDYRRDGLMDETHIRFFTRHSLIKMIEQAGYSSLAWDRTSLLPEFSEFALQRKQLGLAYQQILEGVPDGLTYQFLVRIAAHESILKNKLSVVTSEPIFESDKKIDISVNVAQLYLDDGSGFSESTTILKTIHDDEKEVSLHFSSDEISIGSVSAVRFDPIDSHRIISIKQLEIHTLDGKVVLDWSAESKKPLSSICGLVNCKEIANEGLSLLCATSYDPQIIVSFKQEQGIVLTARYNLDPSEDIVRVFSACRDKELFLEATTDGLREEVKKQFRKADDIRITNEKYQKEIDACVRALTAKAEEAIKDLEQIKIERDSAISTRDNKLLERDSALQDVNDLKNHIINRDSEYHHLMLSANEAHARINGLQSTIATMTSSNSWRITKPIRRIPETIRNIRSRISKLLQAAKLKAIIFSGRNEQLFAILDDAQITAGHDPYELWKLRYNPSTKELLIQREKAEKMENKPVMTVVMPVYKTPLVWLKSAIESVRAQSYPFWELCIADDYSQDPGIRSILSTYAAEDARIKYVLREKNGHIVEASNSCLDIATGEFVVLLDHDDLLAPHALFSVVKRLQENPHADVIYSDEDKVSEDGSNRYEPTCKPKWSPEYILSFMYTGHISAFRRSLVEEVGRFRSGFDGSQDYDLMLRVTERTNNIEHIADVLYHWRAHVGSVAGNLDSKPYAFTVAKKAISSALVRRGFSNAKVEDSRGRGLYAIQYNCKEKVVPHIIQSSSESEILEKIKSYRIESNSSPVCILFNVDKVSEEIISDLSDMMTDKSVGIVAPTLITENNTIFCSGLSYSKGIFSCISRDLSNDSIGYRARAIISFNTSFLAPNCIVVQPEILNQVKGNYKTLSGFVLALCCEVQHQKLRCVSNSTIQVSINSEASISKCSLGSDYKQLVKYYSINKYIDPYLPLGLKQYNYNSFPAP